MKIQSLIKRRRTVNIAGIDYVFEKDDQGRYVADVKDKEHQDMMLAVRCYVKAGDTEEIVKANTLRSNASPIVGATTTQPLAPVGADATDTIAPEAEEATEEEKSESDEGKKQELNREELVKQYEAKFGKKPHHSQSPERIKQLLEEED